MTASFQTKVCGILLIPFIAVAGHVSATPMLEKNAAIWSKEVIRLYKAKNWQGLRSISPLSEKFASSPSLKSPAFLQAWEGWQREYAFQSWQPGSSGISIWRLSEGTNVLRPTMGIKKERDGSWWMVFVQPQNSKNATHQGWRCSPSCSIKIKTQEGKAVTMSVRPPLHQEFAQVHTLGMPVPATLLSSTPSPYGQKWTVLFPGQSEGVVFDVSFALDVCQRLYGSQTCNF